RVSVVATSGSHETFFGGEYGAGGEQVDPAHGVDRGPIALAQFGWDDDPDRCIQRAGDTDRTGLEHFTDQPTDHRVDLAGGHVACCAYLTLCLGVDVPVLPGRATGF